MWVAGGALYRESNKNLLDTRHNTESKELVASLELAFKRSMAILAYRSVWWQDGGRNHGMRTRNS